MTCGQLPDCQDDYKRRNRGQTRDMKKSKGRGERRSQRQDPEQKRRDKYKQYGEAE